MIPTEFDKSLILQQTHDLLIKVKILNDAFIAIEEIEGKAKSASVSISSTSDIRRTCNLVLLLTDASFSNENFEVEYLNKLFEVSVGLHNGTDYTWYVLGSSLLDSDSYNYDATTKELTLNLLDVMAATTEARGSQIGSAILIPYEANVRNALISTIARFSPFKRYDVAEFPDVIPFDQEFARGTYPHAILRQILDLFPYYEMYYTTDGYFTVKPIPVSAADPVVVDETFMDAIVIKESKGGSLRNIKNTTEIWGAELDASYVASEVLHEGDTFHVIHAAPVTGLVSGTRFMFSPPIMSIVGQRVQIDDTPEGILYDSNGNDLTLGALAVDRLYVIKYVPTVNELDEVVNQFFLQGEAYVHVIVKEVNVMPDAAYIAADKVANDCNDIQYIVNPDSPYACDRNGMDYDDGEIRQVFSDGEYSKIYTTQLAFERAAYENWRKTRTQTDIEIECLLVPWFDVNTKVEYTSVVTGVKRQYIITDINMNPAEFTMTVKMSRFYPYYPWL